MASVQETINRSRQTEGRRQQQLLDSGFLDTLGRDKNIPEVELDQVEKVFVKWMGKLVQEIVRKIDEVGPNGKEISATGNLSAKTRFTFTKTGTSYLGYVYMPFYADFRDKGVQGVGPGNKNTTSPYRFRFRWPSKKHLAAIEQWVRDKNNLAIITVPKGLTDIVSEQKSLAAKIATANKIHGIMPGNFKMGAVNSIMPDFTKELAAAMAKDVAISFDLSQAK